MALAGLRQEPPASRLQGTARAVTRPLCSKPAAFLAAPHQVHPRQTSAATHVLRAEGKAMNSPQLNGAGGGRPPCPCTSSSRPCEHVHRDHGIQAPSPSGLPFTGPPSSIRNPASFQPFRGTCGPRECVLYPTALRVPPRRGVESESGPKQVASGEHRGLPKAEVWLHSGKHASQSSSLVFLQSAGNKGGSSRGEHSPAYRRVKRKSFLRPFSPLQETSVPFSHGQPFPEHQARGCQVGWWHLLGDPAAALLGWPFHFVSWFLTTI